MHAFYSFNRQADDSQFLETRFVCYKYDKKEYMMIRVKISFQYELKKFFKIMHHIYSEIYPNRTSSEIQYPNNDEVK